MQEIAGSKQGKSSRFVLLLLAVLIALPVSLALGLVVTLWHSHPEFFSKSTIYLASVVAFFAFGLTTAEMWVQQRKESNLDKRIDQICDLVRYDGLTGALNRTFFLDQIRRGGLEGFLIIFDVDKFKAINDQHGHYTGDAALVHLTREIETALADDGFLGRLGGEEFGVFTQGDDITAAFNLADRIRCRVESLVFCPNGIRLPLTISAGIGQHCSGSTIGSTFKAADENLYAAKAAGRNRVMLANNIVKDMQLKLACAAQPQTKVESTLNQMGAQAA